MVSAHISSRRSLQMTTNHHTTLVLMRLMANPTFQSKPSPGLRYSLVGWIRRSLEWDFHLSPVLLYRTRTNIRMNLPRSSQLGESSLIRRVKRALPLPLAQILISSTAKYTLHIIDYAIDISCFSRVSAVENTISFFLPRPARRRRTILARCTTTAYRILTFSTPVPSLPLACPPD